MSQVAPLNNDTFHREVLEASRFRKPSWTRFSRTTFRDPTGRVDGREATDSVETIAAARENFAKSRRDRDPDPSRLWTSPRIQQLRAWKAPCSGTVRSDFISNVR
jgi:hypothetical protein